MHVLAIAAHLCPRLDRKPSEKNTLWMLNERNANVYHGGLIYYYVVAVAVIYFTREDPIVLSLSSLVCAAYHHRSNSVIVMTMTMSTPVVAIKGSRLSVF